MNLHLHPDAVNHLFKILKPLTTGSIYNVRWLQRGAKTCTYSVSYLQVSTFPEAWQRLPILAGGGEGKADIFWVIPHWQFHFRPDILWRIHPQGHRGVWSTLVTLGFKTAVLLHCEINTSRSLCNSKRWFLGNISLCTLTFSSVLKLSHQFITKVISWLLICRTGLHNTLVELMFHHQCMSWDLRSCALKGTIETPTCPSKSLSQRPHLHDNVVIRNGKVFPLRFQKCAMFTRRWCESIERSYRPTRTTVVCMPGQ